MVVSLLDNTLKVNVFYDPADGDLRDNICVCIQEDCPDEERIFRADETNIYLTAAQASALSAALPDAAERSLPAGMD